MATLMTWGNSDGLKGRCDAKCYDGQGSTCSCMCGGRNHGQGLAGAIKNIREDLETMVEEYMTRNGLEARPHIDVDELVSDNFGGLLGE